jgi:DNA-3-methyladenine glycosylase
LNLDRAFFARHPATVARELVGHRIVHEQLEPVTLRIVETEAYLGPEDPGSHATRGPDTQAGTLWETPGQAYVYVCYGIHQMLNVVAHEPDEVGAVLLRAGEPVTGVDCARTRRGVDDATNVASGPGKLAEALAVARETHDGVDLTRGDLRFEPAPTPPNPSIEVTGRVGLSEGSNQLLRYVDANSPHVSPGPKPDH